MTRKLTLRTRSGLRSSANEWGFREIRFYKTSLKPDDDLWQSHCEGTLFEERRERQFGTRKVPRYEAYAGHKVFMTPDFNLEALNGTQGFLNSAQGFLSGIRGFADDPRVPSWEVVCF